MERINFDKQIDPGDGLLSDQAEKDFTIPVSSSALAQCKYEDVPEEFQAKVLGEEK